MSTLTKSRTTLEYRGYNGSVEFSADDRILHGELVGIRDTVTFEGADVTSLEHNFRSAVDEYLAFCTSENKVPDTPYKGTFNVRISPDLHKRAALFASDHHKKLNNIVREALESYLQTA